MLYIIVYINIMQYRSAEMDSLIELFLLILGIIFFSASIIGGMIAFIVLVMAIWEIVKEVIYE